MWCVANIYCTSDISNPTSVYVEQGDEAVLQYGFESTSLSWRVYDSGGWVNVADGGDVLDGAKYSTSKNPSTELYYRLHILKVEVSAVKKYGCERIINGRIQQLYLELDLLGRCII